MLYDYVVAINEAVGAYCEAPSISCSYGLFEKTYENLNITGALGDYNLGTGSYIRRTIYTRRVTA